jgi:probable phosphoglycerate mutase
MGQVFLIRHGETSWSSAGKHTGNTDVPLTENGEREAKEVGETLRGIEFELVLTSPLTRARETCRLAGLAEVADEDEDLKEWDYGDYEGLTTDEIRADRPGWYLWTDGVLGGESVDVVGLRADRLITRARKVSGPVALLAHGHILRILTARWLGLEPSAGKLFALDPGSISVLGFEHEYPVIKRWNWVSTES